MGISKICGDTVELLERNYVGLRNEYKKLVELPPDKCDASFCKCELSFLIVYRKQKLYKGNVKYLYYRESLNSELRLLNRDLNDAMILIPYNPVIHNSLMELISKMNELILKVRGLINKEEIDKFISGITNEIALIPSDNLLMDKHEHSDSKH